MKKAKWEKLLKLRKAEERLKKQALGMIIRNIEQTKEKLANIEQARIKALSRQTLGVPDKLTAKREWLRGLYLNFLWDEERRLYINLEKLEQEATKRRGELVKASQKRSIAENLHNIETIKLKKKLERQDALDIEEFVDRSAIAQAEKRM